MSGLRNAIMYDIKEAFYFRGLPLYYGWGIVMQAIGHLISTILPPDFLVKKL